MCFEENRLVLIPALLLTIFLSFVVLMYFRLISAMLALPVMALLFAMVAEVPGDYILVQILEEGPLQFGSAIMAIIFGGMLAMLIRNQGIAEVLIRYAAELAGERPLMLGIVLMFVTAMLFTTLSGLGAVIVVGSIVLPIMISVGIPPVTTSGILLIGVAMGGTLSISNWQLYVNLLGLRAEQVRNFMVIVATLYAVVGLIFCFWSLRKSELHRFFAAAMEPPKRLRRIALLAPVMPLVFVVVMRWPIVPSFIAGLLFTLLVTTLEGEAALIAMLVLLANVTIAKRILPGIFGARAGEEIAASVAFAYTVLALLPFLAWTIYALVRAKRNQAGTQMYISVLSAFVPLTLMYLSEWDAVGAFITGFLLAIAITIKRDTMQIFTKSLLEGLESVGPAVIVIIGIGMLLSAISHPNIHGALLPVFAWLVPQSAVPYVITFGLLAPFALYRGPLNIWGLGSGVAAILLATGALSPQAIMAMLASVGAVQAVCDPTNTYNVWIANQTRVETTDIMNRTLVFIWPLSIVSLIIASMLYM